MSDKSELLYQAMGDIDDEIIASAASSKKKRKTSPVKWLSIAACFILIVGIGVGVWRSGNSIEYNYSMIETHYSSSVGFTMPYDVENMAEWSVGFIEFVVLSEPEEITFEYVNQASIDEAIEQNYSEEDMEMVYNEAIRDMTFPRVSIKVENVFYEKEGVDLDEYDEMWLTVDALKYSESFVPGARFAAYVEIMDDPYSSIELYIDSYIYYIDENDNLVPFTDDPSLVQYGGYSLEKMAKLTLGVFDKYNYSMIQMHPSPYSAGCELPYSVDTFAELGLAMIEFIVASEPEEVSYPYYESRWVLDALGDGHDYTEEEYAAAVESVTKTHTSYKVSIELEKVWAEGNYRDVDLSSYEYLWLVGHSSRYLESFVPGGRFVAYVKIRQSERSPVDLNVNEYLFYVDENENLVPFFDDPYLMQYNGYSVKEMAELTLAAEAKLKVDSE